jgi:Protein of unknown function (DUF2721)
MDMPTDTVADVARAIQLALAPVFLLTGISGLLNVMTNRLARIVDRARALKEKPGITISAQETLAMRLRRLERRRHFTSIAITSCTIAALLLCLVVATLFFEAMFEVRLSWFVGIQFMGSTLALVVGLGNFLREVHLATQMRIEMPDTK